MKKTIVITDKVRELFLHNVKLGGKNRIENLDDGLRAVIKHAEQNYAKHLKRQARAPRAVPVQPQGDHGAMAWPLRLPV